MDSNQPPQNSMIENDFFLCRLNDLDELQAIELTIEERKLFAIRQDNNVYAYWNSCPHMGIPLNWMPEKFLDLDGVFLQCSSHGALFQISNGECVGGIGVSSGTPQQDMDCAQAGIDFFLKNQSR